MVRHGGKIARSKPSFRFFDWTHPANSHSYSRPYNFPFLSFATLLCGKEEKKGWNWLRGKWQWRVETLEGEKIVWRGESKNICQNLSFLLFSSPSSISPPSKDFSFTSGPTLTGVEGRKDLFSSTDNFILESKHLRFNDVFTFGLVIKTNDWLLLLLRKKDRCRKKRSRKYLKEILLSHNAFSPPSPFFTICCHVLPIPLSQLCTPFSAFYHRLPDSPQKRSLFLRLWAQLKKRFWELDFFCSIVLCFFACVPSSISRKSTKKTFLALTLRVFSFLSLGRFHIKESIFSLSFFGKMHDGISVLFLSGPWRDFWETEEDSS